MSLYKEFIMKETHQLVVKVFFTSNEGSNSIFIMNSD